MMTRWPDKIPAGTKLNGIQGHEDAFKSLAAADGVPDVAERIMAEKKQVIDGVYNLDYWMGKSEQSNRNHIHYYESQLTAVRMGPWKFHLSTKGDYYANVISRTVLWSSTSAWTLTKAMTARMPTVSCCRSFLG